MRIPPGARVYLTTVISLAGVALATWFGMQAGAAVPDRQWWTLGAVAASVTAAGVPAYEQIRKERMRAKAQRAAVDAAVAMRVTMNDALVLTRSCVSLAAWLRRASMNGRRWPRR